MPKARGTDMKDKIAKEALTFDDVLLLPDYSAVLPGDVDITTRLTRNLRLNIPLLSAAMDTVTEAAMAKAMAEEGGIGIIHRNMTVEEQCNEVDIVKRSVSGMILHPVTIAPEARVADALELMKKYKISGIPVTEGPKLVGILTNRDLRFETRMEARVADLMTRERLVTAPVGTTLEEAKKLLHQYRIEKLLIVDEHFHLKGLITIKDIQKMMAFPSACKDAHGRLLVGAAIGASANTMERAEALVAAGADVISIDTAHGHTKSVLEAARKFKARFPAVELIVGNVATAAAAEALIDAGVDAIKVGMGPGSICTTRIISGAGVPQITAVMDCAGVAARHGVPVIADGGIKYSGDVTKALAAGAESVMIGSLFAGTDESPGELIFYQNRSYKAYRGMGSIGAMKKGSADRYFQSGTEAGKLVPEGVEGRVPYKGSLRSLIPQLTGGLRAGMGYCGCENLTALRERARFIKITPSAHRESHVHDVVVTQEAPNYRVESKE